MCWEFHNVQLRYISFNMWYLVVSVLHMVKSCILNMVFAAVVVVFFIVWKFNVSFAIGHRETIQMNLSNFFCVDPMKYSYYELKTFIVPSYFIFSIAR